MVGKLRGLAHARDEQRDSTGHGRNASHRRKRQCSLSLRSRVQRTDVDDRFATGVVDALIHEREDSEHDQHNAGDGEGFHTASIARGECIDVCVWEQPPMVGASTIGDDRKEIAMLSTVLIVLWLLGMVTAYTLGGLIHILLVVAIVAVLLHVIQGRNPLRG